MKPAIAEPNQLAPIAQPSIAAILSAAVQGGVTSENVAVVKELLAMHREQEAHTAQREFASAFAKLQAEMPKIEASKAVPDNSGGVRYCYAPYEEIMTKARPTLTECGFAITFDTEISEGRVIVTCTLMHTSGHSRSNKFACRIGSGPPKSSEAQGDGAATTYAKRFALCAALNIVVETGSDNDARPEGDYISEAEAVELSEGVLAAKIDPIKFLKWLGAEGFDKVRQSRLADARGQIEKRRKANAESAPQ